MDNCVNIKITTVNYNKICRICGSLSPNNEILSEIQNEFVSKITNYLPIEISFNKNVQFKICNNCTEIITSWDNFYKKFENVDMKFKTFLENKSQAVDKIPKTKDQLIKKKNNETIEDFNEKEIGIRDEFNEEENETVDEFIEDENENKDDDDEKGFNKENNKNTKELNNEIFHCDVCNKKISIIDFFVHMTSHALQTSSNESKTISSSSSSSTGTIPVTKCLKCKKQFKNIKTMKAHVRTVHTKLFNFHCKYCKKSFSCNRLLMNHNRSVHNFNHERSYECKICKKTYKTDSTLYAHKKIHQKIDIDDENNKNLYKCDECFRVFTFKHYLKNHKIIVHTNEHNYECKLCHKKFSTQNYLKKHKDTHRKTLDFTCNICNMRFKLKRYLGQHMRNVHRAVFNGNDGRGR